tara:strand:+ start:479 stop:994 length:516 start_codon:yes stop_codon:yes gene_type:complete
MKNTFTNFFFLILCSGFLFSCGDDDNDPKSTSDIEGVWSLKSMDYDGKYSAYQQGELLDEGTFTGEASDINMTFDFKGDKLIASGSFNMSMEYDLFPGVEYKIPVSGSNFSGTWEANGDKIYFQTLSGPEEAQIISQTANELVLKMSSTMSQAAIGVENVFEMDGVYVLTK